MSRSKRIAYAVVLAASLALNIWGLRLTTRAVNLTPEQLARVAAVLGQGSVDQGGPAVHHPSQLSDNPRAEGEGASEENPMCKVYGPFKDRTKYRVKVIDTLTKKHTSHFFDTEEAAKAAIPALRRQYQRPVGVLVGQALDEYRQHLARKGNRARSIDTTLARIACLFTDGDVLTGELMPAAMRKAWETFTTTKGTRSKRLPSVDTQVGVLKQSRTFTRWLESRGWTKVPGLLDSIPEVEGQRRKGKPKFTAIEDDSRQFLAKALELAKAGDAGAMAAAMGLVMGMRASEIADRLVGDLDDGGRKLAIPHAKTDAGIRRLLIPEVLQPLIAQLAAGKSRADRLFGDVNRHWVLRAVKRVCNVAGVKVISAHGLRGVHAELAVGAGVTGEVVAASLGHESFATTARHYAGAEAVAGARVSRVLQALN